MYLCLCWISHWYKTESTGLLSDRVQNYVNTFEIRKIEIIIIKVS